MKRVKSQPIPQQPQQTQLRPRPTPVYVPASPIVSLYISRMCTPATCPVCHNLHPECQIGWRMPLDLAQSAMRRALAEGAEGIHFRGCDALDHPDLGAMIDAAHKLDLKVELDTDGMLLGSPAGLAAALKCEAIVVDLHAALAPTYTLVWPGRTIEDYWRVMGGVTAFLEARKGHSPMIVAYFATNWANGMEAENAREIYTSHGFDDVLIV